MADIVRNNISARYEGDSTLVITDTKSAVRLRNGEGKYRYRPEIFSYDGQWRNGFKHGKPLSISSSCDGLWPHSTDDPHPKPSPWPGNGCLELEGVFVYEGEFVDGEIQGGFDTPTMDWKYLSQPSLGEGTKTWANGSSYSGAFVAGEMHGHGIFIDTDNSQYEGEWKNNRRNGNIYVHFKYNICCRFPIFSNNRTRRLQELVNYSIH